MSIVVEKICGRALPAAKSPDGVSGLSQAVRSAGEALSEDCLSERSERVPQLLRRSDERLACACPETPSGLLAAGSPLALLMLLFFTFVLAFPAGQAYAAPEHTVPLLMIVADFDGGDDGDAVPYSVDDDWAQVLFVGNDSLRSYYSQMSGGAFTFAPVQETSTAGRNGNANEHDREDDGVVHVTLHQAYRPWGLVNDDPAIADDFTLAVIEAFEKAGDFVDLPGYDANSDGIIMPDELVVALCIPGYDASTLADPARTDIPVMWPHAGKISNANAAYEGREGLLLDSYIAITEHLWDESSEDEALPHEPAGILFHELGHYLGLPDLYPLNENPEEQAWGAYRVGTLSLMDSGGWARSRDADGDISFSPTALDAWSRYVLGWQMPQVITQSGDYVVSNQGAEAGYHTLLVPTSDPDQYFLIENREPEGLDSSLGVEYELSASRGGLVIWRVDKGVYRKFGAGNHVNDTDHKPGVMPVFFETYGSGAAYSVEWEHSVPNLDEPFYAAQSVSDNLGSAGVVINLPIASPDSEEGPSARRNSGVILGVPSDRARSMTVHIDLTDEVAATASREYAFKAPASGLRDNQDQLARLACAALLRETGASVALITSSDLHSGIPEGTVNYATAYQVLPTDSTIIAYEASGSQILDFLEAVLDYQYQMATGFASAGGSSRGTADEAASGSLSDELCFGGITCSVDWGKSRGERISGARVATGSLLADESYSVAATQSAADAYGLANRFSSNTLVLYGSPADAFRSLLQCDLWEDSAMQLAGEAVYVAPADAEQFALPGADWLMGMIPLFIPIVGIAALLVMLVAALRMLFLLRR